MKKGFIFSMDAFLAIILFIFIIFLIYIFSISFFGLNQQYFFSEDLLTTLSETKINELDQSYYPHINSLISSTRINNTDVNIIEQIVTFQLNDDPNDLNNKDNTMKMIDDVVNKIISGNLRTSIDIGGIPVYCFDPQNENCPDPQNVNNLLARTRLSVGKR